MQKHSSFINKEQLHETFSQLIDITREKHDKLGDICYIYDNEGIKLAETDTYQFFISNLIPKSPIEKMLYEMLLRTMYQLETKSGGAAYFTFVYALELLEQLIKHRDLNQSQESTVTSQFETLWNTKLKPLFESCSMTPTEESIRKCVFDSAKSNKDLATATYEALLLSGLEGKIFVETGKQPNYIVELKNGYTFKSVEPFKFLLDSETSWIRNQVKVMVIDGLVEEVSELDHLLNKAHETQQSLLIIAMGFGEEIAATCKSNNDQGKFDVQLLRFTNDVWSLNVANDMAIVCGTTPISSMQGHVVAYVNWDDLPTVDRVQVRLKESSIENRNSNEHVLVHMKSILDKKKEANMIVEDIQNIYDARLKSLASNAVYLYLPLSTEIESKSLRITIDNILRNVKTLMNYGSLNMVRFQDSIVKIKPENELERIILKTLSSTKSLTHGQHKQQMPLLTAALGTYLVTKLCLMLIGSNGYITRF